MKRRILSIILSAALLLSTFAAVAGLGVYAQSDSAEFTKSSLDFVSEINVGINIGNTYDVAECWNGPTGWGNPDITENLIKSIKARGFNAIRLPVTWYGGANVGVAPDYTISTTWMNRVKTIVDLIMDNDMYLIINMHHENAWLGTLTDIETDENKTLFQTHLDQYIAGWTQIAETFKDYGEKLIFEAHNEVRYGDSWAAYWEGYQQIRIYNQTFVDTVRATGSNNAKRYLIFKCFAGGFMGETEFYYDEENGLEPTYNPIPNDPANHLILSYHAYAPGTFCMTQANQNASSNVTTFDEESFVNSLEDTAKKAQEMYMSRGIGVIVGEMGSINKDNNEERLKHAELYVDTMGKYGIKCFWWDDGQTRVNNGGSDTLETFGLVNRSNPSVWPHGDIADVLVNTGNKYLGVKYSYYVAGSTFSRYDDLHYAKAEGWYTGAVGISDSSAYISVNPNGVFTYNVPTGVMSANQIYANYLQDGIENDRMAAALAEAQAGSGYLMFSLKVDEAKDKNGDDTTVGFKYQNIAGKSLTDAQFVALPTGK
ncbi:MAG: glycoside hydrolase family 5 protein, partial [Acutalibacteraceae bacterium]